VEPAWKQTQKKKERDVMGAKKVPHFGPLPHLVGCTKQSRKNDRNASS